VVVHVAGFVQGRPAALAPLFRLRGLHHVGPLSGPGSALLASGSAGEPWASAASAGGVGSSGGWCVGVLVEGWLAP
jgi:hypothetical protein